MDILGLLPSFGNLLYTVVVFVIALSVIVAVHEYGHYIVGRWTGIYAEVFSLGFGPEIYSRVDKHGTRWQIAALPFGGYVKFLGDSDAASGKDDAAIADMPAEKQRNTMHGAPLWARAATVAAGPVFNFVLSILIFAGFFMIRGVALDAPVIGEVKPLPAPVQELQTGDRIVAIEGHETPDIAAIRDAAMAIEPSPTVRYTVRRDDAEIQVQGPFPFPPVADSVHPQSAAQDADMQKGDVILSVDGQPIHAFEQLRELVGGSDGAPLQLEVWRDGETVAFTLEPRSVDIPRPEGGFETRWLMGLNGGLFFEPQTRRAGPLEAVVMGAGQTWFIVQTSLSGLYHMIIGAISTCNLSGPIGIAETSGATAAQGLGSFVWFIAVLSTAVGMLNLFPVPVLDGGHLVFHAYEAVVGRPPSDRALRILMTLGLAMLLSLMAFAVTNDIFCP